MRKQIFIAIGLLTAVLSSPAVHAEGDEPIVFIPMTAKQASFYIKPEPTITVTSNGIQAQHRIIGLHECLVERTELQGRVEELETQVQDLQERIDRLCEDRCSGERSRRHESCLSACRDR